MSFWPPRTSCGTARVTLSVDSRSTIALIRSGTNPAPSAISLLTGRIVQLGRKAADITGFRLEHEISPAEVAANLGCLGAAIWSGSSGRRGRGREPPTSCAARKHRTDPQQELTMRSTGTEGGEMSGRDAMGKPPVPGGDYEAPGVGERHRAREHELRAER